MPGTKNVHKQLGKRFNYREIHDKFGVCSSTACKKVNMAGTDENLLILVPVLGHGTRVLPLKLVPVPGHSAPEQSLTRLTNQIKGHANVLGAGKHATGAKLGNLRNLCQVRGNVQPVHSAGICATVARHGQTCNWCRAPWKICNLCQAEENARKKLAVKGFHFTETFFFDKSAEYHLITCVLSIERY